MNIMLVDDSRAIRSIQKRILAELGYTDIQEAADGVEALSAFKESPPDLMLVDWNMPNMDGLSLVKAIREIDKGIPLIMCTSEAESARVIEAVQAGVNSYVTKPFTAETLGEKINKVMCKV